MKKVCEQCGIDFVGIRKNKRFCSKKCIKIRFIKPKIKTGFYTNCNYCGKEQYQRKGKSNVKDFYCSMEHLIAYKKEKAFRLNCIICNEIFFCQPSQVVYRNRKTCSKKCSSLMQRKLAEERHKSGIMTKHQVDRSERYSVQSINWRKSVFERDDYTCVWCGIRGTCLEADHIKPWAYFPELRYELSNGRTLCKKCHNTTKIGAKRMKEIYEKETIK